MTRWFARAAADAGHATRIVAIDPAPRATLAGLSIELVRSTVQEAGEAPFAPLTTGDVLSIDGSHVLMPGTDVDILLNRVLPVLPAGVLMHIHDVLPAGRLPRRVGMARLQRAAGGGGHAPGMRLSRALVEPLGGDEAKVSSSSIGSCPPAAATRRALV